MQIEDMIKMDLLALTWLSTSSLYGEMGKQCRRKHGQTIHITHGVMEETSKTSAPQFREFCPAMPQQFLRIRAHWVTCVSCIPRST